MIMVGGHWYPWAMPHLKTRNLKLQRNQGQHDKFSNFVSDSRRKMSDTVSGAFGWNLAQFLNFFGVLLCMFAIGRRVTTAASPANHSVRLPMIQKLNQ